MNELLVISGPTATGKTQLAFKLAEKFSGELISADSRQVYKGMDIGTGKEWGDVPIWGYDLVEPNEEWSASHFVKYAQKIIVDAQQRGKLPIVVGGTGLYISNLLNPPETLNIPPDKKLRQQLEKLPLLELQNELIRLNGERFHQMNVSDQRNPRRLIRAIEVVKFPKLHKQIATSPACISYAESIAGRQAPRNDDVLFIGLTAPLDVIDKRIENRVRQRIEQGAEQEVRKLIEKYGWDSALKFTIGYKEWKTDKMTREEIIDLWTTHEKQYARRQLTWVAKYSPEKFFDISQKNYREDIEAYVSRWYYGKYPKL